ncbi:hypothetical protein K488DRAFT_54695 [Vararia minispora EC-137]|uniref:Uncharacterized protein n=1 Tax=Vararia minispora EC-137 TaxID=1314806 RepID=A0ACB8QEU4_9AGAM|nr:hypothetical protein K488DRAFT_54695 [Vararia minispora EC-137]
MSIRLPPVVKQLLTLRTPASYVISRAGLARLRGVLQQTREEARERSVEDGWVVLASCALLTSNVPPAFADLYRVASRTNPDDAQSRVSVSEVIRTASLMREAALKSTIFVGVPRVILSLAEFHAAIEDDIKAALRKDAHPDRACTPENARAVVERGQALWNNIYAPHDVKLANKLGSYHPDFIAFIIQSYGAVLSPLPDPAAQGNLSRTLGSVVGTACLRAEARVGPQLTSHVFGLLKARAVPGLAPSDYWLSSDAGTEWVLRAIDRIVETVEQERVDPGELKEAAKL